jgi:hypothetical protein
MIVKDEAAVITRCLDSVRPHVDAVAVVDTGSTDETLIIAAQWMEHAGLPHGLRSEPWKGFSGSRNDALRLAREVCDVEDLRLRSVIEPLEPGEERDRMLAELQRPWLLMSIDADEMLQFDSGASWPEDDLDGWHVWVNLGGVQYTRTLLTRAAVPWRYAGAVHEDVVLDRPYRVGHPPAGILVRSTRDGARAKDPLRYERDAAMLQAEHERDPSDPRTVFYVANSLRDAGKHAEALQWYDKRAAMAGWDQETWACLHERARCMIMLQRPPKDVIEAHLVAYAHRPSRAEPLAQLAQYMRQVTRVDAVADMLERACAGMSVPDDIMFVDRAAYAPQPRVAIITAPRSGAFPLAATLTAAIAADEQCSPDQVCVFADQLDRVPLPSRIQQEPASQQDLERISAGGVYGTLNLCRALRWAAGADSLCAVLEDDVLFARGWLRRAGALLAAAERKVGGPVVINLHHMHGRLDGVLADSGIACAGDRLLAAGPGAFANGSQGMVCRPATALMLASELRERMELPTAEDRKQWAMDVGLWRCCHELGIARMLWTHPCLLWHQDSVPSTWAWQDDRWLGDDDAHRQCRKTRHFWPW